MSKVKKRIITENDYQKVVSDLKSGLRIYQSLDKHKINRTLFYKQISKEQKLELNELKVLQSKRILYSQFNNNDFNFEEI